MASLSEEELTREAARRWDQNTHQLPPEGEWLTWLMLGGRGAGKTYAGAEWLAMQARMDNARLALVGPTLHDVREVMVEGPSGLRATPEGVERPRWEQSRRRLVWDHSGAVAQAFSAEDAESLRGPQFHAAWADEFCAWREPEAVLANLRLGLRLGVAPRLVVTTTPKPIRALRRLMAEAGTEVTRGGTVENVANLSPGFLANLKALYGGTRLETQELDGLVVEDGGALFKAEDMRRARDAGRGDWPERFEKIVVAVDPPASAHGDACGIVAAGRAGAEIWVLADRSVRGCSPEAWAGAVKRTAEVVEADLILAEANQGGEMVKAVLDQAGVTRPIRLAHATRGKRTRAEPVALLYEQGRVAHGDALGELEEELMALGSEDGPTRSPDRADALVWAVSELMRAPGGEGPRVRNL
ncbi:DNA-packaging protein [Brevundimonas lutea]|uniref:DNA-packaging protein n=1 Tax=Brevundimonas lutea TaxID=2293980 RepID=UPI001F0C9F70|nr:terminase family protein [Brevundimonas lutea]